MVRLCRAPAAYVLPLAVRDEGHHQLSHQVRVARHRGEAEWHGGHAQAYGEAAAAPSELLSDQPGVHWLQPWTTQFLWKPTEVVSGLVCLAEDFAQPGLRRYHLFGRESVQLEGCGPQDLGRETPRFLSQAPLVGGQVIVPVDRHEQSLPGKAAPWGSAPGLYPFLWWPDSTREAANCQSGSIQRRLSGFSPQRQPVS